VKRMTYENIATNKLKFNHIEKKIINDL
jgi:hypothetical protein